MVPVAPAALHNSTNDALAVFLFASTDHTLELLDSRPGQLTQRAFRWFPEKHLGSR
jgi:hypothetical protein